jgi:hypothetical protein
MSKKTLKGEIVAFEVRDEQKRLLRVNFFYNGILHHTWENPRP